jgi:hypothetical protein
MIEKGSKKRSDAFFWGSILIWAGLVFAADSLGFLGQFGAVDAWTWILLGAGVLSLGINLFRQITPDQLKPTSWDWIVMVFFLIVGLSGFGFDFDLAWPIVLIIIGAGMIGKQLVAKS